MHIKRRHYFTLFHIPQLLSVQVISVAKVGAKVSQSQQKKVRFLAIVKINTVLKRLLVMLFIFLALFKLSVRNCTRSISRLDFLLCPIIIIGGLVLV